MNVPNVTQAAPGWGSLKSPVVIVGQSLCEPCMAKQEPFYGGSGDILQESFDRAAIIKRHLYITNLVHCHPLNNDKSQRVWIENCKPYLFEELELVKPKLIVGLGRDAEIVLRSFYPGRPEMAWPFRTPRSGPTCEAPRFHFIRHPSWIKRQHDNSLTRRYVASLERALRWGFQSESTCAATVDRRE